MLRGRKSTRIRSANRQRIPVRKSRVTGVGEALRPLGPARPVPLAVLVTLVWPLNISGAHDFEWYPASQVRAPEPVAEPEPLNLDFSNLRSLKKLCRGALTQRTKYLKNQKVLTSFGGFLFKL